MFDSVFKGIFLCIIVFIGDPYVNLKAQSFNYTAVPLMELA